jgi:hypothetical protein
MANKGRIIRNLVNASGGSTASKGLAPRQITKHLQDLNVPKEQQSLVMKSLDMSQPISGQDINAALVAITSPKANTGALKGGGTPAWGSGNPNGLVPKHSNDGMLAPKVSKPGELVPYSKYSEEALANKDPVLTRLREYEDGSLVPKVSSQSTTTQASNKPAAGSKVDSKKAAGIPGYENMMGGGATLLTAGAGGLVGGLASYATGGEFFQGAAAGSIIGAGGVAAGMGIMNANRSFLAKNAAGVNDLVSSMTTAQRRNAMFGGAGLSGMVFGGDRRSHKRGFNQSRGNTF